MAYLNKHLSVEKQMKLDEYVKATSHFTSSAAYPVTGAVIDSVADIDPILSNQDRTAYQLKEA